MSDNCAGAKHNTVYLRNFAGFQHRRNHSPDRACPEETLSEEKCGTASPGCSEGFKVRNTFGGSEEKL
jgi:hypothetical protein